MTAKFEEAVRQALRAEHAARLTYENIVARYPDRRPFTNVAAAEASHETTLTAMASAHGIDTGAASGSGTAAPSTFRAACTLGVATEQQLIEMYESLLPELQQYQDAVKLFEHHLQASKEHRSAFQQCA